MKNEKEKIQENYDSETIIKTEKGLSDGQFVCIHCGASDIKFNEKVGKLCCSYCKSTFDGKELSEIENNLSNLKGMRIGSGAKDINTNTNDIITLKCDGCGAEVVIDTKSSTHAKCHWCRSILSINSRIENGIIPDAILPFKVKKEEARKIIEDFVGKNKTYMLPDFKKNFKSENIMGVYLPYMIVDAKAHCSFIGEGEHQIRQYSRNDIIIYEHKTYKIKREFDITIDDLIIESSKDKLDKSREDITNNIINAIMPFDTKNCDKFQSNYLVDFTAEKRDLNIGDIEFKVNDQIGDIARHALNKKMRYYDRGIRWDNEKFKIIGTQWITAYLPVWLYSYYETKKDEKILHYIAINGRTQKIMGSIPFNEKRWIAVLIFYSVLCFVSVAIVLLAIKIESLVDIQVGFIFLIFLTMFLIISHRGKKEEYRNMLARNKHEVETKNTITNMFKEDICVSEKEESYDGFMIDQNNDRIDGD